RSALLEEPIRLQQAVQRGGDREGPANSVWVGTLAPFSPAAVLVVRLADQHRLVGRLLWLGFYPGRLRDPGDRAAHLQALVPFPAHASGPCSLQTKRRTVFSLRPRAAATSSCVFPWCNSSRMRRW